jgi:hypothetical protein
MSRQYSSKFLADLYASDSNSLGVRLARVCVEAKLPAAYVAVALETTRTTVYGWFRGQGIREGKWQLVETFIDVVKTDMANGLLPAKNAKEAKKYFEQMLGVPL